MGTRCHMLAMYVVLENYLPMVADYPDAYINQPGFEVIKKIPEHGMKPVYLQLQLISMFLLPVVKRIPGSLVQSPVMMQEK